jgi:hypothetical protein
LIGAMTNRKVKDLLTTNASLLVWMLLTSGQPESVKEYAARWQAGERWPGIVLNAKNELLDGAHRLCAAYLLGHETIDTN